MRRISRFLAAAGLAAAVLAVGGASHAEDAKAPAKPTPAVAAAGPPAALAAGPKAIEPPADATGAIAKDANAGADAVPADNPSLYCKNIANAAADARYTRQADALTALEKEIDDRIAKLGAKRAELEQWVSRRQDFLDKADGSVVAIYSQMRPDAAAQQIAVMDPESAAAILAKLNPRIASAILNEMDPAIAARLTNVMAGLPPAKSGGKSG